MHHQSHNATRTALNQSITARDQGATPGDEAASQRYSITLNETAQLVSRSCYGYHLRYVTTRVPATEGMLGKSCVYITANSPAAIVVKIVRFKKIERG